MEDPTPFVGREDALDKFHQIEATPAQRNALYYAADGGLGKTRLLRHLRDLAKELPRRYLGAPDWPEENLLIDFFEVQNRSEEGLRSAIASRLGEEHFADFFEAERALRLALAETREEIDLSKVAALRRQANNLFFKNLDSLQRDRRAILFFDTFEVVHRRQAGRWFVREFLKRAEGCLIVFAGRVKELALPHNVLYHELRLFKETELAEIAARESQLSADERQQLARISQGNPLRLNMALYLRGPSSGATLTELERLDPAEFDRALVTRIATSMLPEHRAFLDMAYLKRRFDPAIFNHLLSYEYDRYGDVTDFDRLSKLLRRSAELRSMVKYRPADQVLTLHDKVQELFERNAEKIPPAALITRETREELYDQVVAGWYPQQIESLPRGILRAVLRAERLSYELQRDPDSGLVLYQTYSKAARQHTDLTLAELLWGEVADRLRQGDFADQAYALAAEQADWLWETAQFEAAIDLYTLIAEQYTPLPRGFLRRMNALASLGHALMRTQTFDEADAIFTEATRLAEEYNHIPWRIYSEQNCGQLLQTRNQWKDALDRFSAASELAKETTDNEARALALLSLGQLQALLGDYQTAIRNCQEGVNLRRGLLESAQRAVPDEPYRDYEPVYGSDEGSRSRKGLVRSLAVAHLRLAEAYRYAGATHREPAGWNYAQALTILHADPAGVRHYCDALQGMGNLKFDTAMSAAEAKNLDQAVDLLSQAFEALDEAVRLARDHRLVPQLPRALHRLGHVVFESGRLGSPSSPDALSALISRIGGFLLPEEVEWTLKPGDLREPEPFGSLDLAGKAQRLFEVSSLEATRIDDFNTALDSLVEACEVAFARGRAEDVRSYARRAQLPSEAYQEDIFLTLVNLVLADLDLQEGRFDEALQVYQEGIPQLATGGGYGQYLLKDRLTRLSRRLLEMPVEDARRWCDDLLAAWKQHGLDQSHPELVSQIWEFRNILLAPSRTLLT